MEEVVRRHAHLYHGIFTKRQVAQEAELDLGRPGLLRQLLSDARHAVVDERGHVDRALLLRLYVALRRVAAVVSEWVDEVVSQLPCLCRLLIGVEAHVRVGAPYGAEARVWEFDDAGHSPTARLDDVRRCRSFKGEELKLQQLN